MPRSLPLSFALMTAVVPAYAQTVYACVHDGVRVFQDRACGADQVVRELAAAPPGEVAPGIAEMVADWEQRAAARRASRPNSRGRRHASTDPSPAQPVSHRCTAASGAIFFRHGACPARLAARGGRRDAGAGDAVTDEPVPRAEACREISRAGASTRRGHDEDARTDTYERNLGRDPCR